MVEEPSSSRPVFLVSGGTGNTARSVLQAALRQFGEAGAQTHTFHHVVDADLDDVFTQAASAGALVIYTLVRPQARIKAEALARRLDIVTIDVLGPLLDHLETYLQQAPQGVPGLLHRIDDRYYARIAAIEFTLQADDGKDPRRLAHADVVLLGVSRTGKTPLATYLAHKGFKVGNQPIVLDQPLPDVVHDLDPRRLFALTIEPDVLQRIRRARMHAIGVATPTNYSDMGYILAELEYADRLFRGNRWPVIDVTTRAIEETAGLVLRRLEQDGLVSAIGDPSQVP